MSTPQLTLKQVQEWLEQQPRDRVICWDTFEPRYGFVEAYYADQERPGLRGEFDKIVRDIPKQRAHTIATYDADLTAFNYALHYTRLRWQPTAGALLTFLAEGNWRTAPVPQPQYMLPDEEFNQMQDSPDRPADLPRRHIDRVIFAGKEYKCETAIYSEKPDPNRGRFITIHVHDPEHTIERLEYEIRPRPQLPGGYYPWHTDVRGYNWHIADIGLWDQDTVTFFVLLQHQKRLFARWQRQGDRIAIQSVEE